MLKIPERLIYSLSATFSLSLAIFFKKKALLSTILPFELLLQFMVISAIILTINLFLFQKKDVKKIKKTTWSQRKCIFFAGTFLLGAYILTTFGLEFTTSINYSFITRSNLIFTTILAYFFLKEKMHLEKSLLIIVFFVGIYLVTTKGKTIIPQIGDLLILTGAFFFASFSVIQKKISGHLPPEIISWGVTSIGALLAILIGLIFKVNLLSTNGFIFVFLSGLTEAFVILFMNKTIRVANVTYYAMMNMLLPILNGFLGIIFLNEFLTFIQMVGGTILIICGILVQKLKS
ncbi:MAG TPA: DMT family transporter [Atribacterota bacterium]|nr:DMT family transporter [Atribacterota bacterium]